MWRTVKAVGSRIWAQMSLKFYLLYDPSFAIAGAWYLRRGYKYPLRRIALVSRSQARGTCDKS